VGVRKQMGVVGSVREGDDGLLRSEGRRLGTPEVELGLKSVLAGDFVVMRYCGRVCCRW
jgi:hypothetical protein